MAQTRTSIRRLSRAFTPTPPQAISVQTRSLWSCSHRHDINHNLHRKHIRLILHTYPRSQRPHRPTQNWDHRTTYPDFHYQSWRSPGWCWGWSSSRSSFPDSQYQYKEAKGGTRHDSDEIDTWKNDARRRMEWIRREVERDPYAAVFGRRIEPFGLDWGNKLETGFTTLWQSIFGAGNEDSDVSKKAEVKTKKTVDVVEKEQKDSPSAPVRDELMRESHTRNNAVQSRSSGGFRGTGFEYDPITGRMIAVRTGSSSLNGGGKELQRDVQDAEHTSNPESDTLSRDKAVAGSDSLFKSDPSIQEGSTDPEVLKRPLGTTRPYIEIDKREEVLEQLSARDIRAAYEPRRLSIKSEIEAEMPKSLDKHSASPLGSVDKHDTSFQVHTEDFTNLPDEPSSTTTPENSGEEALAGYLAAHAAPNAMDATAAAETYRIFAYDPSSAQVTEAETISSLQAPSEHLHVTEVLTRLANPAKFLPCLNQMNAEGYEIVSGGGDILVFRKVPKESPAAGPFDLNAGSKNFAAKHPLETAMPQPAHNNFYTGNLSSDNPSIEQSRQRAPESRASTVLRRMLIAGLVCGSTCYALGVVSEYFRTGGEDGLGVDGFTQFESERRHREQ
ncbi:hypothetical protein BDW74DRAFT_157633 [Aspergillus multicolor]|uniref:uncharacterized protein n=1 Tax=Aspergillus multicolor TaxID=41759 RepID=UPI003CCD6246